MRYGSQCGVCAIRKSHILTSRNFPIRHFRKVKVNASTYINTYAYTYAYISYTIRRKAYSTYIHRYIHNIQIHVYMQNMYLYTHIHIHCINISEYTHVYIYVYTHRSIYTQNMLSFCFPNPSLGISAFSNPSGYTACLLHSWIVTI